MQVRWCFPGTPFPHFRTYGRCVWPDRHGVRRPARPPPAAAVVGAVRAALVRLGFPPLLVPPEPFYTVKRLLHWRDLVAVLVFPRPAWVRGEETVGEGCDAVGEVGEARCRVDTGSRGG